jgi:hypothetical protein
MIYFAGIVFHPAMLLDATAAAQGLVGAFAQFSGLLWIFTLLAMGRCHEYSFGILTNTHNLPQGIDLYTFDSAARAHLRWLIRAEAVTAFIGIGALVGVFLLPPQFYAPIAAIQLILNLAYFFGYHAFLRAIYKRAAATFPKRWLNRPRD